ncbi:dihydrofolate reductase [Hydrogenophaga sp. 5NK40-0174]|uniref:dihydrofolate reductase n=1 Tax=Hydrogenophaga sp. 5NK40-0174 TaxID=3127649 RepID=UPI0031068D44
MTTHRPRLGLIYARAANGVIGKDNQLPWHLPEDLAHFKRTTLGSPVIMGRKTWDSLPPRFRPLPGRTNIVITRDNNWAAEGAVRANDFSSALAATGEADTAWVIGGAQIYALALPQADVVVVTEIARDFEGDAHAPVLGSEWTAVSRESHTSGDGLPFAFVTYERRH